MKALQFFPLPKGEKMDNVNDLITKVFGILHLTNVKWGKKVFSLPKKGKNGQIQ